MKKPKDQAEAATKAQSLAEEKDEFAEAIKKVAEAEKREDEVKKAQAEKELQQALVTKDAEIKETDEKAYAQGMADITEEYKLQVNIPDDSPLRKADDIPLPFPPPPPPSQAEDKSKSESEDEDKDDDEALVRKPKDTSETKSPPQDDQVLDLTREEDGEIDAEIAADEEAEVSLQETSEVQIQPDTDAEKS
ncbi:methyl-CpG-binding domain-containing protein 10-like [Camellia sinensis]|uniref:methyl-CpG-binding domain-containing protein 10-like n=1 Tax=Camellia sinensis TaxID=4442 RepID=UPI00103582A3|nr:methyl-CpG-binding domain-containing protein 10-like [Camellia sinensis]